MLESSMAGQHPEKLSPRHRVALRCIVSGMPVGDAAALIGLSPQRTSHVYRSPAGQAYAMYLEALADDYVARMLALGLTPQHIASAVGGGKHPEQCRVRKRRGKALHTVDASAAQDDDDAQQGSNGAPSGHEGNA